MPAKHPAKSQISTTTEKCEVLFHIHVCINIRGCCPMASLRFGVNIALTYHNEAYIENGEHNARTNNALSD